MLSIPDLKSTRHASSMKMYHCAVRRLWWPGMYSDFENYVKSCKTCLAANKGQYPKIALKPLPTPTEVFETIHMDLLSISTPSNKYIYIRVRMDSFSKFVVARSLRTKHAQTVATAILEEWFMRFGFPRNICYVIHDNGKEFVNKWTEALYNI